MKEETENIILFDGVCNLCNSSVQFIIRHDSSKRFYFTAQTSKVGKELWEKYNLEEADSIVLITNGKAYLHSDAALEISKNLDGFYKYLYIFRFTPKILRDTIYKLVAKYRYKVFGKKESCMMPSSELEDRFLV